LASLTRTTTDGYRVRLYRTDASRQHTFDSTLAPSQAFLQQLKWQLSTKDDAFEKKRTVENPDIFTYLKTPSGRKFKVLKEDIC
jgi:hypothetical protein